MGGGDEEGWGGWPPSPGGEPPLYVQKDEHWTHFDSSVNAVSFGFVATAILICMFLVMAIFEKFLRATSPAGDIESQNHLNGFDAKLGHSSPKVLVNAREVSVVMPGDNIPTFIAQPAPAPVLPCPLEHRPWPSHQLRPSSSSV